MERLKVATHNICHMGKNPIDRTELFPDQTYRNGYEADMVSLMKRNWREVQSSCAADLIGIQEFFPWFDLAHTIETAKEVYEPYGYQVSDGGYGLAVASRIPLEKVYEKDFAPASARRRQKFYLDYGGKKIAVFNCHPMPKTENGEIRQREYALLIEDFRKEENFIAFGDFNGRKPVEYEIFMEAGYPIANGGIMSVENGLVCDNIVISPNFRFDRIEVHDRDFTVSDHAMLYAEILIP